MGVTTTPVTLPLTASFFFLLVVPRATRVAFIFAVATVRFSLSSGVRALGACKPKSSFSLPSMRHSDPDSRFAVEGSKIVFEHANFVRARDTLARERAKLLARGAPARPVLSFAIAGAGTATACCRFTVA